MGYQVYGANLWGYAPDAPQGACNGRSQSMSRIRTNLYGGIEKMAGWSFGNYASLSVTAGLTAVNSIYQYISKNGDNQIMTWVNGADFSGTYNFRRWETGSASWTNLSNTTLSAARYGEVLYFTTLNNTVAIGESTGQRYLGYYNDTYGACLAVQSTSCNVIARFVETHYNRVFAAWNGTYKSRIWWSGIDTPMIYGSATDYIDINPDDGDEIMGIRSYRGDLYVFKRFHAYKIAGNDFNATTGNYSVVDLAGVPGCLAQYSVVVANGKMYWWSWNGPVEFDGSGWKMIGQGKISETAKNAFTYDQDEAVIAFHDYVNREIWFCLGPWLASIANKCFVYNYITGEWSYENYECFYCSTEQRSVVGAASTVRPIFGSVYGWKYPATVQQLVTGVYQTDWLDFGDWRKKTDVSLLLDMNRTAGYLCCNLYYDYDGTDRAGSAFTVDLYTNQFQKIPLPNITARRVRVKLTHGLAYAWKLNKLGFEYFLDTESGRV